ncbi:NAD(P)-dependent alcohol dehydrogenase [Paracoccaceae bacterium]
MTLPALMKAARVTRYGGPGAVVIEDVPLPQPGPGEVLVHVRAAPVTAGDARMRSGKVPRGFGLLLRLAMGWSRPRNPPGWAFAGVDMASGQRVFGIAGIRGGAHAEYLAVKAAQALPLPDGLSFEAGAAFFFGGLTAAEYLLDRCALRAGERVLINGATGAVGSAALQIARHVGAEVTAVASSGNHALARQLGAAAVIDYRSQPVSGLYDVVLDVIGTLSAPRSHLAPGGRLGLVSGDLPATLGALVQRGVFAGPTGEGPDKMQRLVALFHAGAYRPVLGQVLPFAQLAEAHAMADTFHKPGNLVVVM